MLQSIYRYDRRVKREKGIKMKKFIQIIKYAFWGGISTCINLALLFLMIRVTDIHYIVANSLAYFVAVLVNYACNKKFVFESQNRVGKELLNFIIMRLVSLVIDNMCYYLAVDILGYNVYVSRIVLSVVIIAVTYVINKMIIFKKDKT